MFFLHHLNCSFLLLGIYFTVYKAEDVPMIQFWLRASVAFKTLELSALSQL